MSRAGVQDRSERRDRNNHLSKKERFRYFALAPTMRPITLYMWGFRQHRTIPGLVSVRHGMPGYTGRLTYFASAPVQAQCLFECFGTQLFKFARAHPIRVGAPPRLFGILWRERCAFRCYQAGTIPQRTPDVSLRLERPLEETPPSRWPRVLGVLAVASLLSIVVLFAGWFTSPVDTPTPSTTTVAPVDSPLLGRLSLLPTTRESPMGVFGRYGPKRFPATPRACPVETRFLVKRSHRSTSGHCSADGEWADFYTGGDNRGRGR